MADPTPYTLKKPKLGHLLQVISSQMTGQIFRHRLSRAFVGQTDDAYRTHNSTHSGFVVIIHHVRVQIQFRESQSRATRASVRFKLIRCGSFATAEVYFYKTESRFRKN